MAIEDLKRVSIVDYASYLGYHTFKVGKFFSIKEHDSVRIDPRKNLFYRNSTGEHGSVIDFAMLFGGMNLTDALKNLESYSGNVSSYSYENDPYENIRDIKNSELALPEKKDTFRNVYAYLIKTRGISKEIVDHMVKNGHLYQDVHNNCVFISYKDIKPVAGCIRGTFTGKRFVADISGSDYDYGFFIPGKEKNKTLLVTESVIDMLSFYGINGNAFNYDSLSLLGVSKAVAVINHLDQGHYDKVIIGLDNDEAGLNAASKIKQAILDKGLLKDEQVEIRIPENGKDWNEQLVSSMNLKKTVSRAKEDIEI